jgi:Helitron helicase-like domain at N-terminus
MDDRLIGNGFRPFQIHGEIYHQNGTLEPELGNHPVYAQHYLYDGDEATKHRLERNPDLDQNIRRALETMLRRHNPFPKIFQFAYEVLQTARVERVPLQIFMKIVTEEGMDQRVYNQPIVNEVAALLSGDNATPATRDVIIRLRPSAANTYALQRVPSTSSLYHLLHYVLIFLRGECGWENGMRSIQSRSSTKRRRLTTSSEASTTRTPGVGWKRQDLTVPAEITKLDFLKYRLHERTDEFGLFHAEKLFHQFFVDGWASVEQDRLNWIREHQKKIRADAYNGILDSITSADSEITPDRIGKCLILLSTHLGSDRHMHKLFQDSMAIVRFFGKPDPFTTFTANPHWKEITEGAQSGTDSSTVFDLRC